jgi:hypothetical protein
MVRDTPDQRRDPRRCRAMSSSARTSLVKMVNSFIGRIAVSVNERFDDRFVRHGCARHPFEIAKTSIDCVFAVPAQRRVRDHEVGSTIDVEDPYGPEARQRARLRRHARTPRRRDDAEQISGGLRHFRRSKF